MRYGERLEYGGRPGDPLFVCGDFYFKAYAENQFYGRTIPSTLITRTTSSVLSNTLLMWLSDTRTGKSLSLESQTCQQGNENDAFVFTDGLQIVLCPTIFDFRAIIGDESQKNQAMVLGDASAHNSYKNIDTWGQSASYTILHEMLHFFDPNSKSFSSLSYTTRNR